METSECPKCHSKNIERESCSRCKGAGGFSHAATWEDSGYFDPCDECGGMGGKYYCEDCEHEWEQEPTDKQVEQGLEAQYDYDDF